MRKIRRNVSENRLKNKKNGKIQTKRQFLPHVMGLKGIGLYVQRIGFRPQEAEVFSSPQSSARH
jgi:hypothetical protein